VTRRAPSGYLLCTVDGCLYLGTQAGRCGRHHLEHRDQQEPGQLSLDVGGAA
jgi:hypothetical protein